MCVCACVCVCVHVHVCECMCVCGYSDILVDVVCSHCFYGRSSCRVWPPSSIIFVHSHCYLNTCECLLHVTESVIFIVCVCVCVCVCVWCIQSYLSSKNRSNTAKPAKVTVTDLLLLIVTYSTLTPDSPHWFVGCSELGQYSLHFAVNKHLSTLCSI